MSRFWRFRIIELVVAALVVVFALGGVRAVAVADPVSPGADAGPVVADMGDVTDAWVDQSSVPAGERDETLGSGWQAGDDLAWMVSGDAAALRVFVSRMSDGYQWREIAALSVLGFETDRWVGNACLTSDGGWLAVVYAPRSFTNDETLFTRGGFAAVVNVSTGEVTPIDGGYSLSYFDPGCGVGDQITLSQFSSENGTRIVELSASDPTGARAVVVGDQVTSVAPTGTGLVGALGRSVVQIGDDGTVSTLVEADGMVSDLTVTADGVAYLQHDGANAQAMVMSGVQPGSVGTPVEVASGAVDQVGLARDVAGNVYVTGQPDTVSALLPHHVHVAHGAGARGMVSSHGKLVLGDPATVTAPTGAADPDAASAPADNSAPADGSTPADQTMSDETTDGTDPGSVGVVAVTGVVQDTGVTVDFQVQSDPTVSGGVVFSPASIPVEAVAVCAVARNDPSIQVYQPRPAEVEWAVDQAVRGGLTTPFPVTALAGGGRVPAQVMLGVLAQESNFWQASKYTVPGVYGDPLIANYYGVDNYSSVPGAWWMVDYANADCGYGIAQVTDGMRIGDMDYSLQRAIATDYQVNITRGLDILIDKWNQTRAAGMTINDGDPAYLENWFYAVWAYNSGFHPFSSVDPSLPWGVGWVNNPINPLYPANRRPFLAATAADAAHPQDWPYPERVLGFAANSVEFVDSVDQGPLGDMYKSVVGFQPAWWMGTDGYNGTENRLNVKPPVSLFCDSSNDCNPAAPADPCSRGDSECWYHLPATWKSDCASDCGYEFLTYGLNDPKPAAANSYPPNCSTTGLPAGALIIDNLPDGTPSQRPGCAPVASQGTFRFSFPGNNPDAAHVDLHQLGSGFNGQFWFSHIRIPGTVAAYDGALDIVGTWTLGQPLSGWASVYVHMPSHGAWLQQAKYDINTGSGDSVTRSVNQRNYANTWISLGTLQFLGNYPTITLANNTATYDDIQEKYNGQTLAEALSGSEDIAWDAVAFVPLPQKPSDFIVALGDSFSSGEGTSPADGSGFFRGSDHDGGKVNGTDSPDRNACHRSLNAWPYGIDPPAISGSLTARQLVATQDPRLDFQLLACSGATTDNVLPHQPGLDDQKYGELNQLDRGFLDDNTTLVTLTIGGNDIGFADVITACVIGGPLDSCASATTIYQGQTMTWEDAVNARLQALPGKVATVLQQIHIRAPYAHVLLLGYPELFESPLSAALVAPASIPWLNSIWYELNAALTQAAFDAGRYVIFQNPQYLFTGRNVATPNSAINGPIVTLTPGDSAKITLGPYGLVSAQSFHPNQAGAQLYSDVANQTLPRTEMDLSGTLVGGASTTYYQTFRYHNGGPISLNVTSFSACGTEIRIGLRQDDAVRSGVPGAQDTATVWWDQPQAMQTFTWTTTTPNTPNLPQGWYALNGRLTTTCADGAAQPWAGQFYFMSASEY